MSIIDYYIGLVTILAIVFAVNLIIELRKKKLETKCSFCNLSVGNRYGMSLVGIIFCRRWWCKLLREFGYLKAKQ